MKNGYARSQEELIARGANFSAVHTDWMIGSSEIRVSAKDKSGKEFELIENGQWFDL